MTPKGMRLEAQALRANAERAIAQAEDLERDADDIEGGIVVQVVFENFNGGTSSRYAYLTGDLPVRIGDNVLVPAVGYRKQPSLARVVDVGRGGYTGPLKKLVGIVVTETASIFDDFRESREDKGLGTCPDCGYAYLYPETANPCGGTVS
jgi:uncharacterized OB-fold protein